MMMREITNKKIQIQRKRFFVEAAFYSLNIRLFGIALMCVYTCLMEEIIFSVKCQDLGRKHVLVVQIVKSFYTCRLS